MYCLSQNNEIWSKKFIFHHCRIYPIQVCIYFKKIYVYFTSLVSNSGEMYTNLEVMFCVIGSSLVLIFTNTFQET